MKIPKNKFWRLAYRSEKEKDEMFRLSSIIPPMPQQRDTPESIREKITKRIRVGHGVILANFDDHKKNGNVKGLGIVTAKGPDVLEVQWKEVESNLFANSSAAVGHWKHRALFDFSDERVKDLGLPALFEKHFNKYSGTKLHEKTHVKKETDIAEGILEITRDSSLRETEKRLLISARVGQGCFRDELIKYWKSCPVTGMENQNFLRALHIKPWSISTNQERLNPFNGLLLTPNVDLLFDRGFISFDSQGIVMISDSLVMEEAETMGLKEGSQINVESEHQVFMEFHRNCVFRA